MVGTRQLATLVEQAQKAGCRVILVGDARQLPAIQAGAPFVSLARILGMATLKDIRRQLAEWGRVMVRQFADGDVSEGVEILRRQGLIRGGVGPNGKCDPRSDAQAAGRLAGRPNSAMPLMPSTSVFGRR